MVEPLALRGLPWVMAALLLAACGGKLQTRGDDANEAGRSSNGGTKDRGGAGGSGGLPDRCEGFGDESGEIILVQLLNRTQRPLYLGRRMTGCGLGPLFAVADSSGLTLEGPQNCDSRCQDVARGSSSCAPEPCGLSSVVTLQPEESFQREWHGVYMQEATLPAGCAPGAEAIGCSRVAAIPPGTFTFTALAGTAIDCSPFGDGTCTPCVADGDGGCITYGAIVSGRSLPTEASVHLQLDDSTNLDDSIYSLGLVFEE